MKPITPTEKKDPNQLQVILEQVKSFVYNELIANEPLWQHKNWTELLPFLEEKRIKGQV